MAARKGSVRVSISADTKDLERGAERGERALRNLEAAGRDISGVSSAMAESSIRAAGGLAGMATSAGSAGSSLAATAASGGPAAAVIGAIASAAAAASTALIAVGSSAAAAAAGAGALGIGFAGAVGPIGILAKQTSGRLEEVKEAYEALATAREEGTAAAMDTARQAMAGLSGAERSFVGVMQQFSGLRDRVLGGATDNIFTGLGRAATALLPTLERLRDPFTKLGAAIGDSFARIGQVLANPAWQNAMTTFLGGAQQLIKPATDGLIGLAGVVRDIAVAAMPLAISAFRQLSGLLRDFGRNTSAGEIRAEIVELVGHTKSWFELFRQGGRIVSAFFMSSSDSGKTMVDTLTTAATKVADFLNKAETQTALQEAFRTTAKTMMLVGKALDGLIGLAGAHQRVWAGVIDTYLGGLTSMLDATMEVLKVTRFVTRFVSPAAAAAYHAIGGKVDDVTAKLNRMRETINAIPPKKKIEIDVVWKVGPTPDQVDRLGGGSSRKGSTKPPPKRFGGKAAAAAAVKRSPYDSLIAAAEVVTATAEGTPGTSDDFSALGAEARIVDNEVARIKRALRGKMGRKKRQELNQRLSGLINRRNSLTSQMGSLGPAAATTTTEAGTSGDSGALDANTEALRDAAVAQREHAGAMQALASEAARMREVQERLSGTQGAVIQRAFIDFINGELGFRMGMAFSGGRVAPGSLGRI